MKKWLQLGIGLAISAVFLWYSFSKADFGQLGSHFRQINWIYAIPMALLTLFTMLVRALRWHYLLVPAKPIPTRDLVSPLMIGFAFNGIFPARAGEFARAWLVNRKYRVPLTSAFATVIVERLYDLAMLCAVILFIFWAFDFRDVPGQIYDTRWSVATETLYILAQVAVVLAVLAPLVVLRLKRRRLRDHALGMSLLVAFALGGSIYLNLAGEFSDPTRLYFGREYTIDAQMISKLSDKVVVVFGVLLAGVVLFLIGPVRHLAERLLRALPLPGGFNDRLAGLVHTVGAGLDSLTSWRLVLPVMGCTVALWLLVAWTLQIMAWGFPGLEDMTLLEGLAITMLVCLAIMIPAAPGYWGLYEVGCIVAMQLLDITQDYNLALSYSLTIHALQMAPIIVIGLIYAAHENIRAAQVLEAQEEVIEEERAELHAAEERPAGAA